MLNQLSSLPNVFVKQVFELGEIFGFETRNKYRICDENGRDIGYAAEQQKGILSFLFRQALGHWRSFDIHFYNLDRQEVMIAHHPFRWYFQRLEVRSKEGKILGAIERRFAFFSKRFEVLDAVGNLQMTVSSPIWKIWTFPFEKNGREVARISKKWSGIGFEMFTDRDNFLVSFSDPSMNLEHRSLVLAAAIYVDLMFFESKGDGGGVNLIGD